MNVIDLWSVQLILFYLFFNFLVLLRIQKRLLSHVLWLKSRIARQEVTKSGFHSSQSDPSLWRSLGRERDPRFGICLGRETQDLIFLCQWKPQRSTLQCSLLSLFSSLIWLDQTLNHACNLLWCLFWIRSYRLCRYATGRPSLLMPFAYFALNCTIWRQKCKDIVP